MLKKLLEGLSKNKFETEEEYSGQRKNGKKHGGGYLTTSDGGVYPGEFRDDKFHGQGTYIGLDGSTYVGDWKNGEQHGEGTLTDKNGKTTYSGPWLVGKPKNILN
mgnify:CR=1 FL=1